eukprot:TRINITY_DN10355_c0_g1_i1.p1 TRINITY_DN10355_c0_g1~~TRINITY_DN10355_c0_g1_i1.p1  ORF type:complete len:349 (+),score=49.65 TRINITY_DN10355_c0_g1_i1:24-1070(+)
MVCEQNGCDDIDDICPVQLDFCPQLVNCVDNGETCQDCSVTSDSCSDVCNGNCNNGTCKGGIPELEDSCTNDNDCDTASYIETRRGYTMECKNSVCVKKVEDRDQEMWPGDYCTVDSDCVLSTCDTGNNVCNGQGETEDCDTIPCEPGFNCADKNGGGKACIAWAGTGATCNDDELDVCKPGLLCIAGKCASYASVGIGETCTEPDGDEESDACEEGSVCDGTTCRKLEVVEDNYLKDCFGEDKDTFCGKDGRCTCNFKTGNLVCARPDTSCRSEEGDYGLCLSSNGCHANSDHKIEGSCAWDNCRGAKADDQECNSKDTNGGDTGALIPSECGASSSLSSWFVQLMF